MLSTTSVWSGTSGFLFQTGNDLINISLDPFGFFNGLGSSSTSQLVGPIAPSKRVPNKITCSTVLPNGQTVGSYVNQLSNTSNVDLGSNLSYRNRTEVEAERACVVLDHHDRSCGSSCPVTVVGSVDDQVGSCLRDNPNRHGRFIRNALGHFRCREIHGRADNL